MARINSYTRDKSITTEDTLVGSSYEGTGQQGPIYKTQSYKIGDLATYLNLVFTVDEVNYNLNDMISRIDNLESDVTTINTTLSTISTHVTDNYSVVLDGTSNNFTGLKSLGGSLTDLNFTTTSFKVWDDNTSASVQVFDNINGELKIKKQYLQLVYDDIPGIPDPVEYTTVIYADNANGDNQSLSATNKNYYAFFEGPAKLTSSNFSPPYTGLEWHQLTGDPGDSATAIKLIASKYVINYSTTDTETDTIEFSTIIQNINAQDATYKFYVDGVAQTTNPTATSTFTLPDSLEPGVGAAITVKVELYRSGILLQEDSVSIYGVKDGTDAITAFLTNQSHVVVADNDGDVVNPAFPNAGGTFKVYVGGDDVTTQCTFTVASENGVDVSIVSGTGVYSVNSMSADEATADFQVTIPGSVANTPNAVVRTATYSIAKSIKGDEGLRGEPGSTSKTVHLNVKPNVVKYDEYGDLITSSVLLTAYAQGYTAPQYRWLKDGIEITQIPGSGATSEWTFTNTFTVPTALMVPALETDDWEVQVRENAQDLNPSTDIQTVYGTQANSNAITVVLENDTTVLSTPASGNPNYNYSNNKITVFKGNTPLTYIQNPSPLADGQFTVTATGTDIDPGTESGNNTTEYIIGTANNMDAAATNATIDFAVEIYAGSQNITITKTQTFAKALQGPTGETTTGPKGERVYGSVVWYATGTNDENTPPSSIPNPAVDSSGNTVIYDFDDARMENSSGSPVTPVGWQEDAPNAIPGTNNGVYWTSRFTVTEDIDPTTDQPTGFGTPVFQPPVAALVFNQVVTFQSQDPTKGQTQIDGGHIDTYYITSANYDGPDAGETFADQGMYIDLQNSTITSTHLVLDSNGLQINGAGNFTGDITGASGTFAGTITATTGSIGGWSIGSGSIYSSASPDTSGYTSSGITISSANGGSIHAQNFYIDTNGDAFFRGDISGANLGDSFNFDNGKITVVSGAGGTTNAGIIEFVQPAPGYAQDGYIYSSLTDGYRGLAIYSVDYTKVIGDLYVSGDIIGMEAVYTTSSGYQKLPSGVIVQWVRGSGTSTTSSGPSGTWPVAFPNRCWGAVVSKGEDQGATTLSSGFPTFLSDSNAATVSYSKNKWQVDTNEGSNTRTFFIIAIGN